MSTRLLRLELDVVLCDDLEQAAADLGPGAIEDALRLAAAEWVARRKAEINDRDPDQRGNHKPVGRASLPAIPSSRSRLNGGQGRPPYYWNG